ncbi:MAG: T9SS type A sorting domain-containing protein [Ignavibacteriaceae bacterium]|nr:T9SS type A sorting domain-containing protein [Ignavibacteriaceae bacterium]
MLGCTNVGSSEQVTHYIDAAGEVWQYSGGSFVTGGVYNNSLVTVGNANFQSADWPGFNFNWLYGGPYWSLGLYKVTNSKQTDKYFYLDARDSDFGGAVYNPDFFVVFNNSQGVYQYKNVNQSLTTIPQGSLVSVWQIKNQSANTAGLQNYWSNVLVVVPSIAQPYTPRVIWGPISNFSATGYKIYWRYGGSGNFSLLATVGANTFEYTHEGLAIGNGLIAEYKVQAYNGSSTSDFSNTVSIGTSGWFKQNFGVENNTFNYQLNQNYPNPFNPATVISFSVAENSFISLKVYDVLGNEISELVNEIKEPGTYSVSFDASKLSSGIYFYTLKANGYSLTKKMLLAK